MTIQEIEKRMSEIAEEIKGEVTEVRIAELTTEVDGLKAEKRKIEEAVEKRKALEQQVAGFQPSAVKTFGEAKQARKSYGPDSAEYRSAFLKDLMGKELTVEEREAFVHTTGNTSAVIPTTMINKIWDLIEANHSIMGDITMYRTGTILEVVKRTAIVQGDAKVVNENEANDDEKNTIVKVTLSGKDFSKHVDISYALAKMSMDGFEAYLSQEIADRLGNAMASDVIAQILSDYDDDNNAVETASAGVIAWTDITATFATIKNANRKVVYLNNETLYGKVAGMVDQVGRPIFQANAQDGVEGYLLGAPVKIEDAVTGDMLLIGDATKVVYNMVQDIMIETDRDIKKHVKTYSGYARGEGVLVAPKAFATLEVKNS